MSSSLLKAGYTKLRDFPGSPVVKPLPSSAGGAGSILGRGAKIPHVLWPKKSKHKTNNTITKSADFKNSPRLKKKS